ncbi:hypothetical protein HPB51_011569 [Rhipicephalus microplus]|uniref:SWIM-type domain-containing protein n=1 Tax=Rhipicephalus microplus TaxID=6941 RepID=A0A9J6EGM2_RHIMP|nr:hypothetical protein HPB51_011569 [Rhipicephalus microplus]
MLWYGRNILNPRILRHAYIRVAAHQLLYKRLLSRVPKDAAEAIQAVGQGQYIVPSVTHPSSSYEVYADIGLCTCLFGKQGAFCKHQALVQKKCGGLFPNAPALSTDDRYQLGQLALGEKCPSRIFFEPFQEEEPSSSAKTTEGTSAQQEKPDELQLMQGTSTQEATHVAPVPSVPDAAQLAQAKNCTFPPAAAARRQLPLTVAATTRGLPLLTRASSASPSGASPTCPQRSARHQAAAEARRAGRRVAAAGVSRACCVKILLGRWCAREASGGARWCVDVPCDRCCNGPAIGGQAPLPAAGQLPGGGVSPVGSDDDQDEASAQDRAGPPGWSLFRGFVHENAQCFWNQCLVQSVACLEYRGYLIPSTIFVSGNEYTLEVVRSAWSRRVLRPPVGYEIQKLVSPYVDKNGRPISGRTTTAAAAAAGRHTTSFNTRRQPVLPPLPNGSHEQKEEARLSDNATAGRDARGQGSSRCTIRRIRDIRLVPARAHCVGYGVTRNVSSAHTRVPLACGSRRTRKRCIGRSIRSRKVAELIHVRFVIEIILRRDVDPWDSLCISRLSQQFVRVLRL